MKSFRLLFPVALLAATFLLTDAASAATAPKPPPDLRKLIQSVDVKNSSLVIRNNRDKSDHPYTIDDRTVLTINGSDGKIADVKPGMVVEDYVERYSDTLDSLTLTGYGTEPAKPKSKPAPPKPKLVVKPATNAVQTPAPPQN